MTNVYSNPFSGAIAAGLGGAACVAIGAAIRKNNVHDEAMTQMVGGTITGFMAGFFGCCSGLKSSNEEDTLCSIDVAMNMGLSVAAMLTAQLIGEEILDLNTTWEDVVIDDLIGGAIILGGVCAIAALACCTLGAELIKDMVVRPARQAQVEAPPLAASRFGTFFPQPKDKATFTAPQADNSAQNRV